MSDPDRLATRQACLYFGPKAAMRRRFCMRTVVCRVDQQHNRDRHQCNGSNKDTKHCTHSPDKNCHQKTRKPPERHLRGLLGSSIGYIRQFNDTARAISPPNHVGYVAAVRRKRDLIPPESGGQTARVCANRLVAQVRSPVLCGLAHPKSVHQSQHRSTCA